VRLPIPPSLLAHRVWIALGVALALPSLAAPFAIDDFYQLAKLEGRLPFQSAWWELFSFVPDAARREVLLHTGILPWWSSSRLEIAFFRPLASALVVVDHAVFGRNPLGWHVHSLLWWLALLAGVSLLFRATLPMRAAALALALFAIDDAHWMPITWSAARNGLVAAVPAVLGLCAHLRWRRESWGAGAILGPRGLAVGLLGGVAALGGLAYVAAYELVDGRGARLAGRAKALVPYLAVIVVYGLARHALVAGVTGSGIYFDPTREPLGFATAAAGRVPALLADLVLGLPAELWGLAADWPMVLVAAGLVALAVVLLWLRTALATLAEDEAKAVRWLGAGALLALLPGAAALVGSRLLLLPSVGAAAVFAVLLQDGVRRWRATGGRGRRALAAVGLLVVALPNLVLAAPLLVGKEVLWGGLGERARAIVCKAPLDGQRPNHAVVVWADEPALAQYGGGTRWFYCPGTTATWTVLSLSPAAQILSRPSADSLVIEATDQPLLASEWEMLVRSPDAPFAGGERIVQDSGLAITVERVARGRPQRVRFGFPQPIEASDFRLLLWRDGRLDRLALSIGQSMPLSGRQLGW
jgi:hypothetical protein